MQFHLVIQLNSGHVKYTGAYWINFINNKSSYFPEHIKLN